MPWKKGQSGNPKGRPPILRDIIEAAKTHTELALATLVQVCRNRKANATARVLAANSLLDRGWGKPVQKSETRSLNVNLNSLSDEELLALLGPQPVELEAPDSIN
jgi:hypothetical protein